MIEFESSVDGPFSEQHFLVKIGWVISSLAFLLLLNYVPFALAMWLILVGSANPPHPPLLAWLFVAGLLAGMVAVGWYCIIQLAAWFTGGRFSTRQLRAVVAASSVVSVAVATVSIILGHWESVMLGAIIGLFISPIMATPFIMVGQALDAVARRANNGLQRSGRGTRFHS